jgi:hypothetical protein
MADGAATRCNVHGTTLKKGKARISYGMPTYEAFLEAENEAFPFARTLTLGGCMVADEKSEEVLYCTECRRAQKEWKRKHRPAD